jgi:hypothetical protein
MPRTQFKLKMAKTSARLTEFDERPNWRDLTSIISDLFGIRQDRVGVALVDKDKDTIAIDNEQQLQTFYHSLDQYSGLIKLVVQDLRAPDGDCAFALALLDLLFAFL